MELINQLNEEEFIELIMNEYEEWCGYYGRSYCTQEDYDNKDEEALWDFVMCNIQIDDNRTTIEQLNDKEFEEWKAFFNKIDKTKIWDLVWDCLHPYDPMREYYRNVFGR